MSSADRPTPVAWNEDWHCQAMRHALATVSDAVLLFDSRTGAIVFANPAAEGVYGYSHDELQAMEHAALLADPSQSAGCLQEALARCEASVTSGRHRRRDGTEFPVEIHTCAFSMGEQMVVCGVVRDISARVARTREVRESNRHRWVESLGTLAEEVAHELNNLLTVILGNVELLALEARATQAESLQYIESAARRANRLSEQLLRYGGRARVNKETVDLGAVAAQCQPALERLLAGGSSLVCTIQPDMPPIHADRAQIEDVLVSLITRAAGDTESRQGTVTLRVHAGLLEEDPQADLMLTEGLPGGMYAMLDVIDTGVGMREEALSQLFDPVFGETPSRPGVPLGVVMGIVRAHRGGVAADSTPGEGTHIRLFLPVAESPDVSTPAPRAAPADRAGAATEGAGTALFAGTVLVTDDEATVRTVARKILVRHGFDVLEAADGQEAVDLYQTNRDRIVAVVLDLTMPGMDGAEAMAQLHALEPDLPIVLCSGYDENQVASRISESPATAFLHKPYRAGDLVALLRQVLGRQG